MDVFEHRHAGTGTDTSTGMEKKAGSGCRSGRHTHHMCVQFPHFYLRMTRWLAARRGAV